MLKASQDSHSSSVILLSAKYKCVAHTNCLNKNGHRTNSWCPFNLLIRSNKHIATGKATTCHNKLSIRETQQARNGHGQSLKCAAITAHLPGKGVLDGNLKPQMLRWFVTYDHHETSWIICPSAGFRGRNIGDIWGPAPAEEARHFCLASCHAAPMNKPGLLLLMELNSSNDDPRIHPGSSATLLNQARCNKRVQF